MVELNNLSFAFTDGAPSLGPLNFSVTAPGMQAVLGGNGSGKTVLAQLLAGCYPQYLPGKLDGSARVLGHEAGARELVQQAAEVQLVQQSPRLQLSGCTFSVEEEIAFGPENLCLPQEEILSRIEEAMSLTGSRYLRKRHPATLSGGEAQRVVLAGALAMRPRLLLLDEAMSRLTPQATRATLEMLTEWASRYHSLVILFERTLFPVMDYCSRGILLKEGKIIAEGNTDALLAAAQAGLIIPHRSRENVC